MVSPEIRTDIITDDTLPNAGTKCGQRQDTLPTSESGTLDSVVDNLWDHSISVITKLQYQLV
ncbi:hypothetical protein FSP39_012580 [Pinctada imbricata]|uniref:Uncharacterized protein n=1 Tax=Pinctada imbricata TaxID=66713 RepID=A0AA88XD38_PINIB|nr:hypothetical protein FSP39_012580 [Pinctada imbricata]